MAKRHNFPRPVRAEIARRAVNAIGEKCCENCGAVGMPLELHHLKMDALQTPEAKRKPLTAVDGAMWCEPCHDPESAAQRTVLAKVERAERAHWEPRKPSRMPSRKFPRVAKVRAPVTKVVPRNPLFVKES